MPTNEVIRETRPKSQKVIEVADGEIASGKVHSLASLMGQAPWRLVLCAGPAPGFLSAVFPLPSLLLEGEDGSQVTLQASWD